MTSPANADHVDFTEREPIASHGYFPRRLRGVSDDGQSISVSDDDLTERLGPLVILGEPGMGKSELVRELGRRLGVTPVSAVRFINSKKPTKFVVAGKPLLIDGLDEAMARREGDAVDAVIAQLDDAGAPDFVLSCRSREWQSRGETNLRDLYAKGPQILSLEPFQRGEAFAYLTSKCPGVDTQKVLKHLETHGLDELYRNPLTLGLMGRVAETDVELPASRAALFERVCSLLWPEHDVDRQDGGLAQLTETQALSAAGAIAAATLFAGAEVVTTLGASHSRDDEVRLSSVEQLPGGEFARVVLSSKLFQSEGTGRAKIIHKVVAEFLAARWLAQVTKTPRTQRRLLSQLQNNGGVPASLRGLHAWLAYHSPSMSEQVISADPYGVLRYGETSGLTPSQATCLFNALIALSKDDPFFRSNDWDRRTAEGMMIPALKDRIEAIIASADSNAHLRVLLIEGLKDTALATSLDGTLEQILLSPLRFYRERMEAAKALLTIVDRPQWHNLITALREQPSEDAARIVRQMIELIDNDVADDQLVEAIFAEMGLTVMPATRPSKNRVRTLRHYGRTVDLVAPARLPSILNHVVQYSVLAHKSDWHSRNDIGQFVALLLLRALNSNVVEPWMAADMWNWLRALKHTHGHVDDLDQRLKEVLTAATDIRRAVQTYVLDHARRYPRLLSMHNELYRRMIGLSSYPGDIAYFLSRMGTLDKTDLQARQDWRDLMAIALNKGQYLPGTREAGDAFMRDDKQLATYLRKLENPKKPAWEIKQERDAKKSARRKRIAAETDRRRLKKLHTELQAGEFNVIYDPALVYLGLDRDASNADEPNDRLIEWLGADLANTAREGFEAILHRSDLPSPTQIAEGFATGQLYRRSFAIMAALFERLRIGAPFEVLSNEVLDLGLLLCHHNQGWGTDLDHSALRTALERARLTDTASRVSFARLYIEPSLIAKTENVSGLYMLGHDDDWKEAGSVVAGEWLRTHRHLPASVESDLIEILTENGSLVELASIAETRASEVFPDFERMLTWLAVDILVRFSSVNKQVERIGDDHRDFLWHVRNRVTRERRGAFQDLSVDQIVWILSTFRKSWPLAGLDVSDERRTPFEASEFLRGLINRLANLTTDAAVTALANLISAPTDSYSDVLRHLASEQRQKRAEESFSALPPSDVLALITDGPPSSMQDLQAIVLEELAVAQMKLLGEDIDQVRDFWTDAGIPRDENRGRDRLAAMIGPELTRYDIQRITEADMPHDKRADLAFAHGNHQLPMEIKGQWHGQVWDAASGQLDRQYLIDWRSGQRGVYCVLWFGDLPSSSGRRLKAPPSGVKRPSSAEEMRLALVSRIPEARRNLIDVVVLDLSAGKHPTPPTIDNI